MNRVRSLAMLVVATLAIAGVSSTCLADKANINFILGAKLLDEDDWRPFDEQGEFGIQTTFGGENWPVQVALDLIGSAKRESVVVIGGPPPLAFDLTGSTVEFAPGVRKVWVVGKARPFVGGGLSFVTARIEAAVGSLKVSRDDAGAGGWIDGGAFWRLGKRFNIGVEARISRAKVDIDGVDIQAGGNHLGLLLGFGW